MSDMGIVEFLGIDDDMGQTLFAFGSAYDRKFAKGGPRGSFDWKEEIQRLRN